MAKKKHYDIFKCPECGKDCLSASELKIHLKTHEKPHLAKKRNSYLRSPEKKGGVWDEE